MPWHPPIPFGALYSEDAIQILGPALALLGYCYDKVGRDGTLKLNLHQAAIEMAVPYPTVKHWWRLLHQSCYIATYKERGRAGMDVRMADDWLDWWREDERETVSKTIPITNQSGEKRAKNGPEMGSEVIPNGTAYKVLNNTDQAESHGGSEDRDGTARTHPPAVALYFEFYPSETISHEQGDDVCSTVGDLALWRQKLATWRANGYKPRIGNLLDSYRKDLAKASRNGTHQNSRHATAHSRTAPERYDTD